MAYTGTYNVHGGMYTWTSLTYAIVTAVHTESLPEPTTAIKILPSDVVDSTGNQVLWNLIQKASTYSVSISVFGFDSPFERVPILCPSVSVEGHGLYAAPETGTLCLVGFLKDRQPVVLGFFCPPNNQGSFRANRLALQAGEMAWVAPGSGTQTYFRTLRGGALQMRASPNCSVDMVYSGDILAMKGRTIRTLHPSGEITWRERADFARPTSYHFEASERAHRSIFGPGFITSMDIGSIDRKHRYLRGVEKSFVYDSIIEELDAHAQRSVFQLAWRSRPRIFGINNQPPDAEITEHGALMVDSLGRTSWHMGDASLEGAPNPAAHWQLKTGGSIEQISLAGEVLQESPLGIRRIVRDLDDLTDSLPTLPSQTISDEAPNIERTAEVQITDSAPLITIQTPGMVTQIRADDSGVTISSGDVYISITRTPLVGSHVTISAPTVLVESPDVRIGDSSGETLVKVSEFNSFVANYNLRPVR